MLRTRFRGCRAGRDDLRARSVPVKGSCSGDTLLLHRGAQAHAVAWRTREATYSLRSGMLHIPQARVWGGWQPRSWALERSHCIHAVPRGGVPRARRQSFLIDVAKLDWGTRRANVERLRAQRRDRSTSEQWPQDNTWRAYVLPLCRGRGCCGSSA